MMQERFQLSKDEKVEQLAEFIGEMDDHPLSDEVSEALYNYLEGIEEADPQIMIAFHEARSIIAIAEDLPDERIVPWMEDIDQVSRFEVIGAINEIIGITETINQAIPQEEMEQLIQELEEAEQEDMSFDPSEVEEMDVEEDPEEDDDDYTLLGSEGDGEHNFDFGSD